ncbi:MAG: hypothetical protein AAFP69_23530, partial [Planctomycetota bacterium]
MTSLYSRDAIVAVGSQAERMRLENLIKGMDVPSEEVSDDADAAEAPYIKMYSSSTLDLTTLDAVLQTQLSGRPDARIRINEESKSIIIKGRPETHQEVEAVIKELDGVREEFRKFKLNRKTPQEVALAINRLFGGTEEAPAGPLVDGDPTQNLIWVKGTKSEIAEIEKFLGEIDSVDQFGMFGDRVRMLPYTGNEAEKLLSRLEETWDMVGMPNKLRMVTPSRAPGSYRSGLQERRLNKEREEYEMRSRERVAPERALQPAPQQQPAATPDSRQTRSRGGVSFRFASNRNLLQTETAGTNEDAPGNQPGQTDQQPASPSGTDTANDTPTDDQPADVVLQMTPAGLMVISDDPAAARQVEEMLQVLADQSALGADEPTVFWLRYIKASVASQMITDVLSGSSGGGD